jgi:hypothetical protein
MDDDLLARVARLADAELVAHVRSLIRGERAATAEVIAHLAEMDTRDIHLREGYPSLYVYCRDALGLSEWEAYNRIAAAHAARRFPVILEMLGEGVVHLTAVRRLAPHLTPENHLEVLQSARGKGKREVEEIVARLAPRPDVPFSVRRVSSPSACLPATGEDRGDALAGVAGPTGGSAVVADADSLIRGASLISDGSRNAACGSSADADTGLAEGSNLSAPNAGLFPPAIPARATSRPAAPVMPLSPDRYKLQLTISGETLEMLRLAKDMLGHAVPSGDDAAVVERALRALLTELARKKFADTPAPRSALHEDEGRDHTPAMRKPSRTVPAAVRRVVWVRDLGRCAFVGRGGHRCNERRFVEFHHVDPYALGGEATVDGIQLLCRRHNDYEARLYFGTRRRDAELVPEPVGLSGPRSIPAATSRVTEETPLAGLAASRLVKDAPTS